MRSKVVMKRDEYEDVVNPLVDPILFLDEADLVSASSKKKVNVKLAEKETVIKDIGTR